MTPRTWLLTVSLASTVALGSNAWAGGKGKRGALASPVRYSKIDASTLRVFALGTVGVTTVDGPGAPIRVASPQAGHGTGFAVEADLVITAQHVVNGARHVVVRRPGKGGFVPARVVYSNQDEDIAILHVDTKLPRIRMREAKQALRVRQTVFAVGYPLDPTRTQAQSARGIIAGHLEDASLQLDISLNPGNSGGPLVDEKDLVVGMVISRGDVKKGVQGIGLAVPTRKLRAAVAKAHRELDAGNVAPLSEHDASSAEIVDQLVRNGTLAFGEQVDLRSGFDGREIEKQVDLLVSHLDDSDLLVFLAGNLWNASLAVKHRKVRALGGKTLSAKEADALALDLKLAAIRLAKRGNELDSSIGKRSQFVALALADDATGGDDDDDEAQPEVTASAPAAKDPWQAGFVPAAASRAEVTAAAPVAVKSAAAPPRSTARWTLQASPQMRLAAAGERGVGGGLELKRKLISGSSSTVKVFGNVGLSTGLVSVTSGSSPTLAHSFAAVELGAGLQLALGRTTRLELYAGIAPSYYSVSRSVLTMNRTADYVFDHYRATASLAVKWLNISAGVRSISSTWWLEPIGLGINF
jgi:hypothetical protein